MATSMAHFAWLRGAGFAIAKPISKNNPEDQSSKNLLNIVQKHATFTYRPTAMGISERKELEKEELASRILASAMKLFVEKGVANVTIRNIADDAQYSVGTIYVYFKDKKAILHALHTKGFLNLKSRFMVLMNVADPMERLKATGSVYIRFAQDTKAPIDFVNERANDEWDEGKATFGFVRNMINECMAAGHFSGHEPEALSFLIWSIVHGMCSLTISGRTDVVNLDHSPQKGYAEFLKILAKI
jgi:AcrR family transcriptional regulator